MNLPNQILRGPLWAAATRETRATWALLIIEEQLAGNLEGWIERETIQLRSPITVERLEASGLFESSGSLIRPKGYPSRSVARDRALSESAKRRNTQLLGQGKAQLLGNPSAQLLGNDAKTDAETAEPEEVASETQLLGNGICSTQEKRRYISKESFRSQGSLPTEDVFPSWEDRGLKGERRGKDAFPGWLEALEFRTVDGSSTLAAEEWEVLSSAFPAGLLRTELPAAALWLRVNPRKRKKRESLLRFLASVWMKRAMSRPPENGLQTPGNGKKKKRDDWDGVWRVGK